MSFSTVYTPFLRRFTDERARDLSETIALYRQVRHTHYASLWSHPDTINNFSDSLAERLAKIVELPQYAPIAHALDTWQRALLARETTIFSFPEIDWSRAQLSMKEHVDLRRFLRAKEHFLANQERVTDLLCRTLGSAVIEIAEKLSGLPIEFADADDTGLTVPLYAFMRSPGGFVWELTCTFMAEPLADAGIFTDLQERLYRNVCRASGVEPYTETKRPLTLPYESDLPTEELIDAYLGDTPFVDLLATRVPFVIPLEARLSHSWIIGQPGTGKSTLLQHLITNDFLDVYHDEKCVVVMESNRDLIKAIEGSAVFAPGEPLEGKLLSIDLEDVEWPIALNLFDIGLDQIEANADPKHRRALLTSVLFLYDYIFGGLLGAELTSRQNTLFTFTIQLLLHIPGATLDTLIDLMQPKGLLAFQEHLSKLSRDAQRFFELKFNSTEFSRTKDQVVDRLFAVKRITTLSEMFASPKTKLDFYTEMGKAQVILINAPLSLLQADGVEIVGRFFIAMILLAAQKRQLLPQAKRLPCMIYIDECQDFIWRDTMIPDILDQARKLKVSLTLAHQRLNQLENYVLDALYGSTAVKFASQISDAGAHALARDMRTTPEFILNQPPFHFAAYVRGLTSNAVSIGIPRMDLTRAQRMTSEQAAAIRDEMRSRYSVHFSKVGVLPEPEPEPPPPPTVPSPPPAVPPSSALVEPAQAEEAGAVETEKKKRWPLS